MSGEPFLDGRVTLHHGDCLEVMRSLPASSIDAIVTDPPYGLGKEPDALKMLAAWLESGRMKVSGKGFMGREWDAFVPQPEVWREALRVLKPGGHVIAAFGTRTYDLGCLAIRIGGFEIRDMLQWLYGSGFPKSLDVSRAIDRHNGDEREKIRIANPRIAAMPSGPGETRPWLEKALAQGFHQKDGASARWQGWGTALKPACEPWVLARKPLDAAAGRAASGGGGMGKTTVAENVLAHGVGGLNIDACLIGAETRTRTRSTGQLVSSNMSMAGGNYARQPSGEVAGRWPANVLHDGSDEVLAGFPGDAEGSAARFFFSAKADGHDRAGSKHPTIKPVDLMAYFIRLLVPKGATIIDPFAGSGTTGEAAFREGVNAILIEREAEYCDDIRRRRAFCLSGPDERKREASKARHGTPDAGPLFGGGEAPGGGALQRAQAEVLCRTRPDDRSDRAQEVSEP